MTTKRISSLVSGAALVAVAVLASGRPASADLIPSLLSVSGDAVSGFTWDYDVDLTVDERLMAGDYVTIYDFNGYIPGSVVNPAGWTFSATPTGPVPPGTLPADNPDLYNLTWTWTGGTVHGEMDMGQFYVKSTIGGIGQTQFAGYATRDTGAQAGTKISNIGKVSAPTVPEPGTLPLVGSVLLGGIGILGRRRRA